MLGHFFNAPIVFNVSDQASRATCQTWTGDSVLLDYVPDKVATTSAIGACLMSVLSTNNHFHNFKGTLNDVILGTFAFMEFISRPNCRTYLAFALPQRCPNMAVGCSAY